MTDAPNDVADSDDALGEEGQEEDSGASYVDLGIEDVAWESLQDWQPAATYDTLYLVEVLEKQDPPGRMELHTFAYLACLMSVFKGQPASDWGYGFSAVPPTLPFSPAIELAISDLLGSARLSVVSPSDESGAPVEYALSERGRSELEFFGTLESFQPRTEYLRAAGKTALFTSMPAVVNSLSYEPQLAQAIKLDNPRLLLTEVSSEQLYREFDALLQVLGTQHEELIVPASLYVRFLQQRGKQQLADEGEKEE